MRTRVLVIATDCICRAWVLAGQRKGRIKYFQRTDIMILRSYDPFSVASSDGPKIHVRRYSLAPTTENVTSRPAFFTHDAGGQRRDRSRITASACVPNTLLDFFFAVAAVNAR